MDCFHHRDKAAIGLCKECYRGLCHDCASDLEHGIACKDKHEEAVITIKRLINFNKESISNASISAYITPAFFLSVGLFIFFYGYMQGRDFYLVVVGLLFGFFGLVMFIRTWLLYKKVKKDKNDEVNRL